MPLFYTLCGFEKKMQITLANDIEAILLRSFHHTHPSAVGHPDLISN